jgi:PucR family transcriptional regulator, purine catabolism regulatory protein
MRSFSKHKFPDLQPLVDAIHSPVDLNPVLQLIVERVRSSDIWPMCAIGIADAEEREIQVPAQSGFLENYPKNIKFPAIGSATLEAIHRNQSIAISDVLQDTEFPVLQEAARAAGYRSILLVPLQVEEIRAAVTFCFAEPHYYTQDEIQLANAIAQQVMIAIHNASQYAREKQRAEQLQCLNQRIAEQNRLLQRVTETHTALTRLVLDDVGMDGIVKAIRNLLGNPVGIENENFKLLVHSDDREQFDHHRLASLKASGTVHDIFSDPTTVALINSMQQDRRAILLPLQPNIGLENRSILAPITAGRDILGYVWVMESLRPFDEHDLVIAEQAALVLALEMVKQRATYETELRLKGDFLDDLLSSRTNNETELLQRASYLGYKFTKPSGLLVLTCHRLQGGNKLAEEITLYNRQLILCVQRTANQYSAENIVAFQSGQILVVLPVSKVQEHSLQGLRELTEALRQEIKTMDAGLEVLIGIGDIFQSISETPVVYRQAQRAMDAARSLGRLDGTFHLNDLGVYGVLYHESDQGEMRTFAEKMLQPLQVYDGEHNAELVKTLDVYLANQGHIRKSAERLYIHVNTLRQRLERIEDVLGVELDNSWVRLNLQLALRVYEVLARSERIEIAKRGSSVGKIA